MQDALKRLKALQQELESLHRTTARVLAESEQLIGEMESPVPGIIVGTPKVRNAVPPASRPSPSRRARKRRG
ncbi:MAG TPA: hypothetical protein VF147_19925 [Vicinamibacterales bacterium]